MKTLVRVVYSRLKDIMTAFDPTALEKEKIHKYYLTARELLGSGIVPPWAVQRGFEETMGGFLDVHTWRPTHISHAAANEILQGRSKLVQRAHGIGGRLDRYERTVKLLTDPEKDFDTWWKFYLEHDATVLITKSEHNKDTEFDFRELIPLPPHPHGMFERAGFSFKVRKKVEVKWLSDMAAAGRVNVSGA